MRRNAALRSEPAVRQESTELVPASGLPRQTHGERIVDCLIAARGGTQMTFRSAHRGASGEGWWRRGELKPSKDFRLHSQTCV